MIWNPLGFGGSQNGTLCAGSPKDSSSHWGSSPHGFIIRVGYYRFHWNITSLLFTWQFESFQGHQVDYIKLILSPITSRYYIIKTLSYIIFFCLYYIIFFYYLQIQRCPFCLGMSQVACDPCPGLQPSTNGDRLRHGTSEWCHTLKLSSMVKTPAASEPRSSKKTGGW